MGFFGQSAHDSDVEKATSAQNTKEDWTNIIEICDKAGKSSEEARNYLKAILKRLNNSDPHISLQAATLLDACVNNSGKTFHLEIASREFETEFVKLVCKGHTKVQQKLKESLKRWSDGEFKTDPQLILVPTLYSKLVAKGVDFSVETTPKKNIAAGSKDPNVVDSQEEQDQIAQAIELSLKEKEPLKVAHNSSLYPTTNLGATAAAVAASASMAVPKEKRKVRALYDFEAAEDNELTFNSGEIIFVLDDSDPNWWKGTNQRGEGLFPASFVTADLTMEPDQIMIEKKKKLVQLDEDLEGKAPAQKEPQEIEINEQKIDRLLHLLHEADPTNPEHDTTEMLSLEREVNNMGPLIDSELERVDRKHAQLTQLSSDLVEALSLYHTLMREPQTQPSKVTYGYQPSHVSPTMTFNGNFPPNMPQHPMMGALPPGHDRQFMHSQGGPSSMPPHFSMPPQALPPPGHLPPGLTMPPGMPPPNMQQHQIQDDRIPPNSMPHFPPQGMPNYGPTNVRPPGFPSATQMQHQNGGPHYPPTSNTHM